MDFRFRCSGRRVRGDRRNRTRPRDRHEHARCRLLLQKEVRSPGNLSHSNQSLTTTIDMFHDLAERPAISVPVFSAISNHRPNSSLKQSLPNQPVVFLPLSDPTSPLHPTPPHPVHLPHPLNNLDQLLRRSQSTRLFLLQMPDAAPVLPAGQGSLRGEVRLRGVHPRPRAGRGARVRVQPRLGDPDLPVPRCVFWGETCGRADSGQGRGLVQSEA